MEIIDKLIVILYRFVLIALIVLGISCLTAWVWTNIGWLQALLLASVIVSLIIVGAQIEIEELDKEDSESNFGGPV